MLKVLFVLFALTSVAAAQRTVPFETPEGLPDSVAVIVRVKDGDTVVVQHEGVYRSVRLIGADTPEMRPPQPFSAEATAFTAMYAGPGTPVMLVGEGAAVDRFGRALKHVLLLDAGGRPSTPLALMLLSQGLAKADIRSGADKMRGLYEATEAGARSVGKGIFVGAKFRDVNCNSFKTQPEAQWFALSAATPQARDKNRLDPDNNGVACEKLPRGTPTPTPSS